MSEDRDPRGEIERDVFLSRRPVNCPIDSVEWRDYMLHKQAKKLSPGLDYCPTHLPTWNASCRGGGGGAGLATGWHVLVAANPGIGKSLMALNLAARFTAAPAYVGILTLEMSAEQVTTRWLSIVSGTPLRKLEQGDSFDEVAATAAWDKAGLVPGHRLHVEDSRAVRNLDGALATMRQWQDHGVSAFIIDYMQLLTTPAGGDLRMQTQEVSLSLADFAKDNNVLTIGLSQFNRETSRNYEAPPQIQGLYGGAVLEGDADQVVMIDHSRHEKVVKDGTLCGVRTWVLLGKNRHGPGPEIPVYIDYKTLRMTEALQDEEHLWPGVKPTL